MKTKEKRTFKHLSKRKRYQIEALLLQKIPVKEIAKTVQVHISTIYREVKRGAYLYTKKTYNYYRYGEIEYKKVERYSPDIAQEKYEKNMLTHGVPIKLGNDYKLANYLEKRILKDKLTPLAVIGEIRKNNLNFNTSICVKTLYNYIHKNVFYDLSVKDLPILSKRKKRKSKHQMKSAPRGISIENRPLEILSRSEFGHWEMDCVESRKGISETLLCLSERQTRYEIVFRLPAKSADNVVSCINCLERKYKADFPKIFKTITVDNGAEFSNVDGLEASIFNNKKRTTVYYCHPYSSYERGTNERLNREIRRIYPKGTDFSKVSKNAISKLESWMNTYPRYILNFNTSANLFNQNLSCL